MITRIGLVAGEIWDYLEKKGKKGELNVIIEDLRKDKDLVFMSVGWLAREGHVILEGSSENYSITLV